MSGCAVGVSRPSTELETKYALTLARVDAVAAWLETHCRRDRRHPRARVRSIYYDTLDWRCLREKIDSDYLKIKVRLRWYEAHGAADGSSFLEAKLRIGSRRRKLRIETEIPPSFLSRTPLCDSTLLSIPLRLLEHEVELPESLRPVCEVSYERRRFIEPGSGARLSLDSDIRAPRVNELMLPGWGRGVLDEAVFECKSGARQLPVALRALERFGLRRASFSKYAELCRKMVTS